MRKTIPVATLFLIILSVQSCDKESITLESNKAIAYYPTTYGKKLMYRLDSTVYLNLGTKKEVHTYYIEDRIDTAITDNTGRKAYRIFRTIRDLQDTTLWKNAGTYLVIPDSSRIEVVQDNLRYIKLINPVIEGLKWQGHAYFNTEGIPGISYMSGWEFQFENINKPLNLLGNSYAETIQVTQRNDTLGTPGNKNFFFELNVAKEIYAKNKGLIYKEFLHEAWQPGNSNSSAGYYEPNSYGIKMTLLKSN